MLSTFKKKSHIVYWFAIFYYDVFDLTLITGFAQCLGDMFFLCVATCLTEPGVLTGLFSAKLMGGGGMKGDLSSYFVGLAIVNQLRPARFISHFSGVSFLEVPNLVRLSWSKRGLLTLKMGSFFFRTSSTCGVLVGQVECFSASLRRLVGR